MCYSPPCLAIKILDARSRSCREVPINISADRPAPSVFPFHSSILQIYLSSLESTLMKSLVSVAGKELTGSLSLLDATLMKNRGEGGCYGLTRNPIRIPGPEREQRADRVKTWKQIDYDGKEVGGKETLLHNSQLGGFHPLL